MNDLLLVALIRTVGGWNGGRGAPTGRVSVLVPVNLRPKEWHDDLVTNLVLDARVAADPQEPGLLAAVQEQSERIKQGGGPALLEAIGGWRSLPLWAKSPVSPAFWASGNRLVDTALLSNLGALDDLPDFGARPPTTWPSWCASWTPPPPSSSGTPWAGPSPCCAPSAPRPGRRPGAGLLRAPVAGRHVGADGVVRPRVHRVRAAVRRA